MELSELIHKVDIVDYISQYIELEQRGEEWWGLSCFKPEKTPSFSVRRDPPFFYDYASGIGGNLYNFIKAYERCGTKEAVSKIKAAAGYSGAVTFTDDRLETTKICKKYKPKPKTVKEGKAKPLGNDYMERYEDNIGKLSLWLMEGITPASLRNFQVRYDSFSDSIVYPIRDVDGNIVNVGGRTLDPLFKEHGKRKYFYFHPWGTMQTIYGLAENIEAIKAKHEIILFEGCKSVMKAWSWGYKNCGAILTSHLNPSQTMILIKLGCNVVFALDKEIDIRQDKHIQQLRQYVNVYYLNDKDNLLDEKDAPVDQGEETFRKLYERRVRYR